MTEAAKTPLLDVRDLRVRFGTKEVVRGASFSIAPGEKLALVGESGSGKTITALSLLRLAGDAAITGQALLQGRGDLLKLSEREMRGVRGGEIAMVFQEPMTALNPLMTIGMQIAEILQLKKGLTGAQCAQAAIELLAQTGIPEPARRAGSFPHQLSGGQRQRAMIAMALASQPKLLLADEPTTALDVTLRGQILDLLSDLQRQNGMAVLLITHDLNLVHRFADRVAVMEQGVLVEHGAVAEVFGAPQHDYTRRLIASQPRRDVVEGDPPAGTAPVVQVEDLRVTYPTPLPGIRGWFKRGEFVAVQDASLRLLPGQTLGVVGESGSGKSTLAQAILGLLPHTGQVQIDGGEQYDVSLRQKYQNVSGSAGATASHHSSSTRNPTTDPPMASGRHQAVALYRPQAAPAYPITVARTRSCMTDQMTPSMVVPVPRNDGMNQRNVVPNRKTARTV